MDQAVSPRKITSPRVLANSSPRNMKTVVLGEQNTFKQEIRKAKETTASLVVVRGPSIGKRYLLEAEESVIGEGHNREKKKKKKKKDSCFHRPLQVAIPRCKFLWQIRVSRESTPESTRRVKRIGLLIWEVQTERTSMMPRFENVAVCLHVDDADCKSDQISSSSVVLAKDDLIKLGGTLLKFAPPGELDGHFLGSLGHAARTDPVIATICFFCKV